MVFWKHCDAEGHAHRARSRSSFILTFEWSRSHPMWAFRYKSLCVLSRHVTLFFTHVFWCQPNCSSSAEWNLCVSTVRPWWIFWFMGLVTALTEPPDPCLDPQSRYYCCLSSCCWPSDITRQTRLIYPVSNFCFISTRACRTRFLYLIVEIIGTVALLMGVKGFTHLWRQVMFALAFLVLL